MVVDFIALEQIVDVRQYGLHGLLSIPGFFWLVCLYWHTMVVLNVSHCAACGVMASWFFGQDTTGVTWGAFKRSITTSFGSICFGSLLTAIINALRVMASIAKQEAKDSKNNACALVFCCLECILQCLGDILEYFNGYVYVQIAVYGKSYCDAAKDTLQLFQQTGVKAIINDDLTGIPIAVGWIILMLVVGVISWIYGGGDDVDAANLALNIAIAEVLAILIYYGTAQVLISYIMALFVCWAENPAEFSLNRPEEFNKMIVAANNMGHSTAFAHIGAV